MKWRIVKMPTWRYSVKGLDPERTAIASGRDLNISLKEAYEVLNVIRGMRLDEARRLLEEVIALKQPIPFKRYNKKVPHHRGLERWKWPSGRYPVKVCRELIKILDNVENNAINKGLDPERLKIIHAAAQKGPVLKKYTPRAFGRATRWFRRLTHIEIAVMEV